MMGLVYTMTSLSHTLVYYYGNRLILKRIYEILMEEKTLLVKSGKK